MIITRRMPAGLDTRGKQTFLNRDGYTGLNNEKLTIDGVMGDNTKNALAQYASDVKAIQSLLKNHGYKINVDGIWGEMTQSSIIDFQRRQGLKVDGIVGAETRSMLASRIPATINANTTKPKSKNFKFEEFACKDKARTPVPPQYWAGLQKLMNLLEVIRIECGNKPITITSGYRTPEYNRSIGGAGSSRHTYGDAADIIIQGVSAATVCRIADRVNPNGGGGSYPSFTHVDTRSGKARWKE